ncbi:MAG TPA: glycoside hydrolase family 20 zincin-like fold domain-containing protein, partial [Candidatus Solibacter sp.]|nr:glycoside hydrolase family 20 zincin-like fold domain-containing protein [Candidatus Solibacter sp.]
MTIRFGSDPSPEDRVTAGELSSFLSAAAGTPIGLSASPAPGRAITLKRTGPVAALPVPGEHPGPESREAYAIQVTPGGVNVEGRSSAALYYAAQTLHQLVDGQGGPRPFL